MSASDHLGPQFYHGSPARLAVGAHIVPPVERNPADPDAAKAHPVNDGSEGHEHTFMTEWPVDARNWAGPSGHVYTVEPMGDHYPDWNGGEGDYAVRGHLRITGMWQRP